MSQQTATFNEAAKNKSQELDLFTNAIKRAHGKSHPETYEIRELFEVMDEKVKEAGTEKPNLDKEFTQLRDITDNYTAPRAVCGTYIRTYEMLSEIDKAYHA